jgi:cation diffusion facilitator CzcD-associated flavoprotein CzcO
MTQSTKAKFIIIGSGFSGLIAAVRLQQIGENDILILERAGEVGGVWRDNRYPGCACDVESHLYSLSFAQNPDWSHRFAEQPEIYHYLQNCYEQFGLIESIRFHHEVQKMVWNDEEGIWYIQTNDGEYRARIVVGAFGALSDPSIPKLHGIEKFKGQAFHSAQWPETLELTGRKVAVIGTGASAIQFIPEIQPEVKQLYVFQRTPAWVIPRLDGPISETMKKMYRYVPFLQRANRMKIYTQREFMVLGFKYPNFMKKIKEEALAHMHSAVSDNELRRKLTPGYEIGCKRILLSNTYYPSLAQPNVEVNTNGIAEVVEEGIIDQEGHFIEVDTLIYGTGFKVTNAPLAEYIYGKTGLTLAQAWNGSPKAYMGIIVEGFPNLFIMQGPNTGLGHSSVLFMMEAQALHMQKAVKYIRSKRMDIIEPKLEAQHSFVEQTARELKGTVWETGGCTSWYMDETGRNSSIWPSYTFSYRRLAGKFQGNDYKIRLAGISSL